MKILISVFLSFTLISGYSQDIVILEKDQKAPYKGALVPPKKLDEMRQNDEQRKILIKQNITLKELNVVLNDRVELNKDLAEDYRVQVSKAESRRYWSNIGNFLLGVLATSLAFRVTQEVTND